MGYWPVDDEAAQTAVCTGLRNGAPAGVDPRDDKIMSCGVVVFTFAERESTMETPNTEEIVGAEFLFGGHMETALTLESQSVELADLPDDDESLEDYLASLESPTYRLQRDSAD